MLATIKDISNNTVQGGVTQTIVKNQSVKLGLHLLIEIFIGLRISYLDRRSTFVVLGNRGYEAMSPKQ